MSGDNGEDYGDLNVDYTAPANKWLDVTPGENPLPAGPSRALHNRGTSGTVTAEDIYGNSSDFYILQGATLPIRAKIVSAVGADVEIVALY